jgi:uncharacterized protein (UPF0264 family)
VAHVWPGTSSWLWHAVNEVSPRILVRAILKSVAWRVEVTAEFADWARKMRKLDRDSSRQVGAAVELLKEHGPSLKRPLVGEITTSKIKNMKELRPDQLVAVRSGSCSSSTRGSRLSSWWLAIRQETGGGGTAGPSLGLSSCMRNTLRR